MRDDKRLILTVNVEFVMNVSLSLSKAGLEVKCHSGKYSALTPYVFLRQAQDDIVVRPINFSNDRRRL